jgi:excisionase family DNA binding protein
VTELKAQSAPRMLVSKRLFRTKEAAVYLGFSAWQIRRLVQDGELPIVQCSEGENGRHWRIDVADLDRFIERHKRTAF